MKEIIAKCPVCGRVFVVAAEKLGELIDCPQCEQVIEVEQCPATDEPQRRSANRQQSPYGHVAPEKKRRGNAFLYEFNCNQCGGSILADESVQGKNIKCPHCDKLLTAPPQHVVKPFNMSSPPSRQSAGGHRKVFKVEVVQEGAIGTLLVGSSKIPQAKLEEVLNR